VQWPLLADVPPEDVRQLLSIARRTFSRNEVVVLRGRPGRLTPPDRRGPLRRPDHDPSGTRMRTATPACSSPQQGQRNRISSSNSAPSRGRDAHHISGLPVNE